MSTHSKIRGSSAWSRDAACAFWGVLTSLLYVGWRWCSGAASDGVAIRFGAPIYGVFVFWVLLVLRGRAQRSSKPIGVDVLVVLLAGSRVLISFIPISGHVLFLVYSIGSTRNRMYLWVAGIALLDTTYLKLFEQRSIGTWVLGCAAACYFLWMRRQQTARLEVFLGERSSDSPSS